VTLVILADDLTGACDAAAPFAARGLATTVLLARPGRPLRIPVGVDVLAADLDTRRLGRRSAVARTAAAARDAYLAGASALYKKVDSTLRGHVSAELRAVLRGWRLAAGVDAPAPRVVLCPAFPALGRRVVGGRLLVEGQGDLGSVAELAGFEPSSPVIVLSIETLASGARAVAAVLSRPGDEGMPVLADATEPRHLTVLAEAAALIDPLPLLAGSAGLATALADRLLGTPPAGIPPGGGAARSSRIAASDPPSGGSAWSDSGPWLVVAGSQTAVTAAQVAELEQAGAEIVPLDAPGTPTKRRLALQVGRRAARALAAGVTPVIRLLVRHRDAADSPNWGDEDRAARALARACRTAVVQAPTPPAGLFLTGGLTARACLLALGVEGIRLSAEPLPGIALGRALGGAWDGRSVITKAGGFGAPDAIRRLV
jgi:D-threonate/D-erythronate kinase